MPKRNFDTNENKPFGLKMIRPDGLILVKWFTSALSRAEARSRFPNMMVEEIDSDYNPETIAEAA